jgi:hypothetical protein
MEVPFFQAGEINVENRALAFLNDEFQLDVTRPRPLQTPVAIKAATLMFCFAWYTLYCSIDA